MLSNPPTSTNLHTAAAAQRRRQHRRQNSTPSAFETVKIQKNLPMNRPSAGAHRRGLSLDTRRQSLVPARTSSTHSATNSPTATRQDFSPVSIPTNQGLTSNSQHSTLRGAQQQRIQARPGAQYVQQQHQNAFSQQQQQQSQNEHENFLISPHGNPQTPISCFDPNSVPFDQYLVMQKNQANFAANNMTGDFFGHSSAMSTPTYVDFQDSPTAAQGWISEGDTASTRRTTRRISNGIMDRVSKFENMGSDGNPRPTTPPNQNANSYFPPTPMETPHDPAKQEQQQQQQQRPNRFSDGYDESMEETIKPNRRSNQRTQNIFEDMRRQAEAQAQAQAPGAVPTPPRSNTMPNFKTYEGMTAFPTGDFMDMNNFNTEFLKIQGGFEGMEGVNMAQTPHSAGPFGNLPDLRHHEKSSLPTSPSRSQASRRGSPHRRTESLASIASAASIASINIEDTKTETGVTMEDISTYISGPDPSDNKWICLYEACGKKFGRKENIKSHVQTHLNDRQYQCPTCKKCFVRQHDLKRHAKIHTGIKPYPCECGNSFARHDALTRHRQRGMCIGAFDGIVRKVVKRGRPRKNRPDMDRRVEKATRTRKKNMSISSVSSQSGCSDSSAPNSPRNDFDMLEDNGFDLMDVAMENAAPMLAATTSCAPMPALAAEMPNLQAYANSPEPHDSPHSYVSPEAIMEPPPAQAANHLPPHPTSPAKSVASQLNEPPELSQSSSPPACRLFDTDPNTSGADETTLSALVAVTSAGGPNLSGTLTVGMGDQEEMLLKGFGSEDNSLLQLDREHNMFMMSKFDEEYGVNMLGDENDMFFES